MIKFMNDLIWIFININESIKNGRKIKGVYLKITYISTANCRRLQNLVANLSWDIDFRPKWLNIWII